MFTKLYVPVGMSRIPAVAVLGIALLIITGAVWWHTYKENLYSAERLRQTGVDMKCSTCVAKILEHISETEGTATAFRILRSYYNAAPESRKSCHFISAELGSATARTVNDFRTLHLTPETTACDYGFYQAYPGALLKKTRSLEQARDFCSYAGVAVSGVPNIESECLRGLGQELPFIDPSLEGNAGAMADSGVALCRSLTPMQDLREHCLAGVFFAIGKAMHLQTHRLSIDRGDPISLCRQQDPVSEEQCLRNILKDGIITTGKNHPDETLEQQYRIVQGVYPGISAEAAPELIWVLAYEHLRSNIERSDVVVDAAKECAPFNFFVRNECVRGFSLALAKHSTPNKQHAAIISFCQAVSERININKARCANKGFSYLKGFYNTKEFTRACTEAKKVLNLSCDEILNGPKLSPDDL